MGQELAHQQCRKCAKAYFLLVLQGALQTLPRAEELWQPLCPFGWSHMGLPQGITAPFYTRVIIQPGMLQAGRYSSTQYKRWGLMGRPPSMTTCGKSSTLLAISMQRPT